MKHSNMPAERIQTSPISTRESHSTLPSTEQNGNAGHTSADGGSLSPATIAATSSPQTGQHGNKSGLGVLSLGGLSVIELSKRVYNQIFADNCSGRAAQLAYYFLFALFPFLLFLTTLLAYIPIPRVLDRLLDFLSQALPGDSLTLVQGHVRTLISQPRGGLLSFGIIAALWTASNAILAVTSGLNRAYGVEESRPWWKVRGTSILLVIGLSLFLIAATVLLMFGPQIGRWIAGGVGLGDVFSLTWNILRWPVSIILLMFGLAILYYFAPDVEQRWRWVTPGSVVAVIGWIIASLGFSYYVTNFGSYNVTYGSIGTVIVLLTWLYLTGLFILVGGQINAEIEHASPRGKNPGERTHPARQ
jgi:membrane protein